jgi:hypothetical protein
MEAEPRIIELRDTEAQAVNHAYGTTGLITALEMPLAPSWNWIDVIVAFPTFIDAARFGHAIRWWTASRKNCSRRSPGPRRTPSGKSANTAPTHTPS